ncbi:TetR/AcrR family transcriptional regulator [Nocardia fluminea]|uniref:TetR family transcriptional regulator n=2 Tax=Nocardia fluminea TaxID=134984 RepID=A0A2N3VKA6_9NOCA|nr:TetR/AcrR family transcriptional regulator [Nocardia fluminea]PKV82044.1 TetR family transcriptional regulator [Nocardia fluminea]
MFENKAGSQISGRPAPVQRRGVERVEAILEAAEVLLCEQGYDGATLKAIGERTGIPQASIYHYFGDRNQVDVELARRHVRELDALTTAALDRRGAENLTQAIVVYVDLLLTYFREFPAFVELWYFGRSPAVAEVAQAFDDAQAERLWRYLIDRNFIGADTPRLVVELAFEAGNKLFDAAFRRSRSGDDATISEAKRLINAYLATYAQ